MRGITARCPALAGKPRVAHWPAGFGIFIAATVMVLAADESRADLFTYVDRDGTAVEVQAELLGSGEGVHALEFANGRLLLVPQAAVKSRQVASPPEPLDAPALGRQLVETFGADRMLVHVDSPFVIGYVSANRMDDDETEQHARVLSKNAVRFMESVQSRFLQFARRVRVPVEPLKYPLVILIFESDADFDAYVPRSGGALELSAGSVAGFYDLMSNYLVLRQRECQTFEVPLHEAIHQQAYNRGMFKRMAPIPAWFNEGLATGFEADGDRVQKNPASVSLRYASLAFSARSTDWSDIVTSDRPFYGDMFAGEAYGQAWGLHWLLVTEYPIEYGKFIRSLAAKEPFEPSDGDQRARELEEIVGKRVSELQNEFYAAARLALSKRRFSRDRGPAASYTRQASFRPRTFFRAETGRTSYSMVVEHSEP